MNDKETDAVRRTLERIQRMASEPLDDADPQAGDLDDGQANPANRFSEAAKRLLHTVPSGRLLAAVGAIVLMAIGAAGLALMETDTRLTNRAEVDATPPEMPAAPAPPPAPERQATPRPETTATLADVPARVEIEAQGLLESGRVSEARRSLASPPKKSPEAALILARSYDPNYLRLLPDADAAADPAEAERWYRT